eukprot:m.52087 g.52087  ORF g.52087 m.52087 type:complete len:658 (+) comp21537_c0_seq1:299-2272(+)
MNCTFDLSALNCSLAEIPEYCHCSYIQQVEGCQLDNRIIPYLQLPKCYMKDSEAVAGGILFIWMVYVFAALELIVEYSVVPNLVTISKILGLSDIVAGVTLLALGNGVTDIFTAVSSVRAASDGGALAVSGLLGSSMFVFSVNAGLISLLYTPVVELPVFTRDLLFYLGALGFTGYMLGDRSIVVWQIITFVAIYVFYIFYVVTTSVRRQRWINRAFTPLANDTDAVDVVGGDDDDETVISSLGSDDLDFTKMDPETALLLGLTPSHSLSPSPCDGINSIDNWSEHQKLLRYIDEEKIPLIHGRRSDGTTPTMMAPNNNNALTAEHQKKIMSTEDVDNDYGVIPKRSETPKQQEELNNGDKLENENSDYQRLLGMKRRTWAGKVLVVIQAPVRFVLLMSVPVLLYKEYEEKLTWNRQLALLQTVVSFPIVVLIWHAVMDPEGGVRILGLSSFSIDFILGTSTGLFFAFLQALTSTADTAPRYRAVFSFWGFFVSVSLILLLTDEVVGLMRDVGIWFELSHSFIGNLFLGVGNGMCDLVANLVVARNGWPHIAMAAIYGGSILNLLIGMALASTYGLVYVSNPYYVSFDVQNVTGLGASFLTLTYVLVSVWTKRRTGVLRLSKTDGVVMLVIYALFVIASITLEIMVPKKDREIRFPD